MSDIRGRQRVRQLSAALFDMDGLMFDSERLSWRLINQAGAEFGCDPLPFDRYILAIGKTAQETRKIFSQMCGGDQATYNAIEARFWELDRQYVRRFGPPKKPGLLELLSALAARDVPCAVASSTQAARVEENLETAGIRKYFAVVIGGDQAPHSKPAPDIFLRAAELLGYPATDCLVVEDSFAGVRAGHATGAFVVMVPDLLQPTEEIAALTNLICKSLSELAELVADNTICFSK